MPDPLSDQTRSRLRELSRQLLQLHKALLDVQRRDYDADSLPIRSQSELLQLVLEDPAFAWLRALSAVIVQIDELVETDDLATEDDATALVERTNSLIHPADESADPEFAARYRRALQASPDAVIAHGAVVAVLAAG